MDSIGSILRNRRCERALSLEEAHHATKITLQNLAALEDDQFDSFPNRVYARAFLRDYANYLGLESGPLLERYEAEWGPKDEPQVVSQHEETPGRRSNWWLVVAGFLITAAAVVVLLKSSYPPISVARSRAISRVGDRLAGRTEGSERAARPAPARQPAPAPQPEQPRTPAPPTPPQPQGLNLTVTATQEAWIRVETDSARAFEGTLAPGQSRTWTALRQIRIRTGNAGGIRISLNGKNLGAMGPPGQIRTKVFVITPISP